MELRFTVPSRSTDKQPLRGVSLTASFCRAIGDRPCQIASSSTIVVPLDSAATPRNRHTTFTWTDMLPSDLTRGDPRSLRYGVELLNASGRSAGMSNPAFSAAGQVPAPVDGLHAESSRLGVLLRWSPSDRFSGDTVLQRENLALGPKKPETIQLTTPPSTGAGPRSLLDASAKPDTLYRYTAIRRAVLQVAGHTVELRSAPSDGVEITLQTLYPPPIPAGVTAAAFAGGVGSFAVDLIWQPVDDAGLITPLAGYNVYRSPVNIPGQAKRLNPKPLGVPAFHDTTASPATRYRYGVTSVDVLGNESAAGGVVLEP